MFSKRTSLIILFVIIILAGVIRFYKLGLIPHGMTWDEAAIGYNGYAVLTTRRDEWLHRLPVSFKSFGDFKAPLAVYLDGPFIYLFGANATAMRLPFAVSGVLAVLGVYFLIQLIGFEGFKNKPDARVAGLLSAVILTLMPWHIFFSRTGFESGLALTLVIWAVNLFLMSLKSKNKTFCAVQLITATLLGVLSLYAYHSAKIFTPLLALLLLAFNFQKVQKKLALMLLAGISGIALLIPLIKNALFGQGLQRAGVSIFSQGLSFFEIIKTFTYQLGQHLHPSFVFLGQTDNLRHGDGRWGVVLPTTAVLVLSSLIFFVIKKYKHHKVPQAFYFYLWWVFLGILPSAIATEAPHSNRSLLAIPGVIGLSLMGLLWLKEWLDPLSNKNFKLSKSVLATIFCLHILFFVSFASDYLQKYRFESSEAFLDGYLEVIKISESYRKGINDKPKVEQIVFSREYGQPYIYILFATKTNPIAYQGGILSKYLFQDEVGIADLGKTNALLVAGRDSDLPENQATHLVFAEDGSLRFKLYYLPEHETSQEEN